MEINKPHTLAPAILLSIANEKLRLHCNGLAELVYELEISVDELNHKLDSLGYHYDPKSNQYTNHHNQD